MSRDDIFATIVEIICSTDARIEPHDLRLDDTPFQAYGMSSLQRIRLASLVEDRYDITITDSDAFTTTSIARLVDLVRQKMGLVESGSL